MTIITYLAITLVSFLILCCLPAPVSWDDDYESELAYWERELNKQKGGA